MHTNTRYFLSALVLLVAGAALYYWMLPSHSPTNEAPTQINTQHDKPKLTSANNEAAAKDTTNKLTVGPRKLSTDLQKAFDSSQHLKEFIDKAGTKPEAGSYFYATRVTRLCGTLVGISEVAEKLAEPSQDPRIREARKLLLTKCEGVRQADVALEPALMRSGAEKGDPLFGSIGVDDSAKALLAKKSALTDLAFTTSDPYILADVLSMLAIPSVSKNLVFEGKPLNTMSSENVRALEVALSLVPCDLGLTCGRDSLELQFYCATGSCAHDSLESLVKARESSKAGSRFDWNQVAEYRRALAAAIARGDRNALGWV
jgi:hypothetical protein